MPAMRARAAMPERMVFVIWFSPLGTWIRVPVDPACSVFAGGVCVWSVLLHRGDHCEAVAGLDEPGEVPGGENAVEGGPVCSRGLPRAPDRMDAGDHVACPHRIAEIDDGFDESVILREAEAIVRRHIEPAGQPRLR